MSAQGEDVFFERLALHTALPFVRLHPDAAGTSEHRAVNPLAATLVSEDLARRHHLLPIACAGGVLTVATSRPLEAAAPLLDRLRRFELSFVLATELDVLEAIDRVHGPASTPASASTPSSTTDQLIGERLVARGTVSREAVEQGLEEQARTGSRLGAILVQRSRLGEDELVAVLAEQHLLPTVDLTGVEPSAAALALLPEALTRRLRCVPLEADARQLTLAVADVLSEAEHAEIRAYTDVPLALVLASPAAIEQLTVRVHEEHYAETARGDLLRRFPENSADRVATGRQKLFGAGVLVATLLLLILVTTPALIALTLTSSVIYLAASLYKFRLVYNAMSSLGEIDVTPAELAALDERTLPPYTILVPLYREAAIIDQLVDGIGRLDYPATKLDVRLLCEADDDETIDALRALDLPPQFRVVVVPDAQPKTKPKACNFGLIQAVGEFVVIYDAEDRPDPDQLKKVIIAFRKADPAITCIQAKLNYFNADQNLLTRWFTIEYSMWFELLLPGLDAEGVPIPLGGTSNHFITERLLDLGAWDPFNVTEDADLGIRLHKVGFRTAMVDSVTLEEANSELGNWVRQRSRWIKGYLQTYLVHMRHPVRLFRALGPRSFISFQLVVGGTVILLMNPILWALTTAFFFTDSEGITRMFPPYVYYAASFQLFIGNFVFMYLNVAGSLQRGGYFLAKYALLSPLYWGLMSLAAWKGAIQLVTNPFYWEKTEHGLATDPGAAH